MEALDIFLMSDVLRSTDGSSDAEEASAVSFLHGADAWVIVQSKKRAQGQYRTLYFSWTSTLLAVSYRFKTGRSRSNRNLIEHHSPPPPPTSSTQGALTLAISISFGRDRWRRSRRRPRETKRRARRSSRPSARSATPSRKAPATSKVSARTDR